MKLTLGFLICLTAAAAANAETTAGPISGKDAKKLIFAPQKAEVEVLPEAALPDDQVQILQMVGESQPYYGAVAISPDEGMMVEATVAAANFHDTAAASVAALAECDAKRKGAAPCIIAAYIRPKGWKDKGFSLSSDAAAAFKTYDMKTGALAISVATGAFGLASGEGAADKAVAACAAKNDKAKDCALVVQN